MVRELKAIIDEDAAGSSIGGVFLIFWAALLTVSLISAIIFSCADGVSKEKASTSGDTNTYGGGCAAGCGGAGCGAACGG